ncbi:FecR family protein [Duganella sp. sic0402]|uniref:FecR family protein n=1 Tax=Duganella sp. sic0402 TaxID=2854786 RepID=UPI001C47E96E|nr:FecR domain-containing protein [Duganella sp. sic0402]MBV7537499.1 FecR family protein [Duganella sp. sic0402]
MWSQFSPNNSLRNWRRLALGAAMLACGAWAQAGEAGRIVFVSGEVFADSRRAVLNDAVQEGQELSTGKDGYVYLKTADDGLLILRPASRARIVTYHIDRKVPANTHVKLELLAGVARSVSGSAVKQARQNFRFNTPVAAIGVRGTDFTVFTDHESSSVTVLSGAIVVSGFGGACLPTGGGPCEHTASRELAAGQAGQMLKVKRGETAPQLLNTNSSAPDALSPPRSDEPSGKSSGSSQALAEPALDAQKAALIIQQVRNSAIKTDPPAVPPPEVVVTTPTPTIASSELMWGRWAAIADQPATVDSAALLAAGGKRVAYNSYYTVIRTKGADWEIPQQGSVGFALRSSDALVLNSATQLTSAASLQNGQLQVDFDKRTFSTGFDLLTAGQTYKLQSTGFVGNNGDLSGNVQYVQGTNMAVSGSLGANNNAAYIFSSRLDDKRTAYGATYWTK